MRSRLRDSIKLAETSRQRLARQPETLRRSRERIARQHAREAKAKK